jgi:hypothetical protein
MISRTTAAVSGKALASFGSSLSHFAACVKSDPRIFSCSALTSSRILGWRDSS